MSSIRFLADEDLRYEIVLAVRRLEAGIEFSTVNDRNLAGSSDAVILQFAHENGLITMSHDVNTIEALAEERISRGGVWPASFSCRRRARHA